MSARYARLHSAAQQKCYPCSENKCYLCCENVQLVALPTTLAHGFGALVAYADELDGFARVTDEVRIRAEPHSTIQLTWRLDWNV
jgi:hypothetical protein